MTKVWQQFYQMFDEVRTIARREYPMFVYGGEQSSRRQEVPVFVFHGVAPQDFEQKLRYLRENNYRTISCDEYYAWLVHGETLPDRPVLLAIDDGVESVWQFAYPLLEKYELAATVFLIPGYIRDRPAYFPNAKDVWEGRCGKEDLAVRSDDYYNLLYWEEIETMHASGVMDFQSHSLYHHQVYASEKLAGFYVPGSGTAFFDWVIPQDYEASVNDGSIRNRIGFPVYESDSIFRGFRRYVDNEDLREKIQRRVAGRGGIEFFEHESRAQSILTKEFGDLRKQCRPGVFEAEAVVRKEITDNLQRSRELIESRLKKKVRHLCYPYSQFCHDSVEISKDVGYLSNFIGTYPGRRTNYQGQDPYYTVRLKNDFLPTLPGTGRISLTNVLASKLKKRATGDKVW